MSKNTQEPTDSQVKKRLREFARKHRDKYPIPPKDDNEPEGLLAGNLDKIKERIEEEFGDNYGEEKPKLKIVKKKE